MKAAHVCATAGALIAAAVLGGCGSAGGTAKAGPSTVYVMAPTEATATSAPSLTPVTQTPETRRPHRDKPRATTTVTVAPPEPTRTTVVVTVAPQPPETTYYSSSPSFPGTSLTTRLRSYHREDVKLVQAQLNYYGYGPIAVDGHYGPVTESTVRSFQSDWGLYVDGVVGPRTWESLFAYGD